MTCDLIRDIMTSRFTSTCRSVYIHFHTMRSMNRDLFRGQSRFMACYASNKFLFFTENNGRNCMKCIETHVNAVACVPMHFRHQTNIQFSVPPKIICLIRVSSLNRRHLIDKNAAWFFTFFKLCILTESHVTKLIFFFKKNRKFWHHIFSIAYDDFNDIYDDMNPSLYCLPILRDEIRVFVQCSSTARGHNLDFHSGYR